MSIINKKLWDEYVEINKDSYSKACVDVAREAMQMLDKDDTPLHAGYNPDIHTAHGIICKADDNIGAGGISGAMAGCVAYMIKECHSRGEEFYNIYSK